MITRAYQNANGKRQEIFLSSEDWDVLTEDDLNKMLGFKKTNEHEVKVEAPKLKKKK